jgi:peroxiredoxin Q/BCP
MLRSLITGLFVVATWVILGPSVGADESIKVNEMVPDFELKGSDGKTYKMSDLRGKTAVVIAWYPKAFTGG